MVNISKIGDSAIKFTFTDNDRYLYNGEITLPLNSLILEFDTSDLVIFKKIDGDVFVTFLLENSNFNSKAELESWYKANMVGSTGGGGVTSGEVQTMIDEAVSGKANSSDVYTTGQTSGATEIANALNAKLDATAYTPTDLSEYWTSAQTSSAIDEAVSGKVDTEDLDISGKTLYVGDYRSGSMPYELAKEYPISTKPTKLLVKRTVDGDATNVTAFQLYFDNGTTSGSCILRVSSAVGSGITEAAWQVETPEASLELVNGEVYITFLNGYYLTMFKPATYISNFVMQIVTDIESGSTPSVVESGIYNALDKMSETLTDVITKSDAAYYKGIGYPSLSYSSSSGITFSSSAVGVGVGVNTATTSSLATDASIGADNGVLGVYTTGATHTVVKNYSVISNRININSIPSNIKMYWNLSYTGNTSHYIAVSCTVNDGTNGYCQWDWENNQYVPNDRYINTAVTLSYDSTNQVVTITPSSSSALTSIIYVRCNRNIAPATALTQDNCRIGLVTIDTNLYKLQEALDNKQDTLSAGTNITISGNVISANGVQVSSAITENDTNPVEGGALYDELRIENAPVETTLTFTQPVGETDYWTTNYPSGCTTLVGNILRYSTQIELYNNSSDLGGFIINCYDGVLDSVTFWGIEGTYSISGSVVTISYPNTTNVTRFRIRDLEYQPDYQTYKAMATVAPTVLKNQVNDNTTALGGLKLQQISQSDYDNLLAKDASTLYVII